MSPASVLLASALAVAPALATAAEQGRSWMAVGSPERFVMSYATPQTDDGVLSLSCTRATKEIGIAFVHEPVGAKDGMRISIDLISEGGNVLLQAEGHRLLLDDVFVLEARTPLTPALQRVLTQGLTLTLMVQDGSAEVPLEGAGKAMAALIEACT